jgi:hypothetical protein
MRWIAAVGPMVLLAIAFAGPDDTAKAANTRGMQLYAKKDYAGAATEFRAAIASDRNYVLARYNLSSMAALLGDKKTVLEQLQWLHDSYDRDARKVLDKAATDPDFASVIGDLDVKRLIAPDCKQECGYEDQDCGMRCPAHDRGCDKACTGVHVNCAAACDLGLTASAKGRMRAWVAGQCVGRVRDTDRMSRAYVISGDDVDKIEYGFRIDNEIDLYCDFAWGRDGAPGVLSNCSGAKGKRIVAFPTRIDLTCKILKKEKVDRCEAAYSDGRITLERKLDAGDSASP